MKNIKKTRTKNKKETVCQKAYRLLKDIPEDEWMVGDYTDGKSKCCAIGHYSRLTSNNTNDYSYINCIREEHKLRKETNKFLFNNIKLSDLTSIIDINDGEPIYNINREKVSNELYSKTSPKTRVLLLLKDCIAAGY